MTICDPDVKIAPIPVGNQLKMSENLNHSQVVVKLYDFKGFGQFKNLPSFQFNLEVVQQYRCNNKC